MKKLEIIVRPERFGDVVSALQSAGVAGMTVTDVRGQGCQRGTVHYYRGTEFHVDFLPKVKIETVVPDDLAPYVLEAAVTAARTGQVGDGKIFVLDVEEAARVRTGDRGDAALAGCPPGATATA